MVLLVLSSATIRLGHAVTLPQVGEWIVRAADTINPIKVVQRTIDDDFKTAGSVLVTFVAFPLGLGAVVPIIMDSILIHNLNCLLIIRLWVNGS